MMQHFLSSSMGAEPPTAPDPAVRRRQAIVETIEGCEIALAGHQAVIVIIGAEIVELEKQLADQLARRDAGLVLPFDESCASARYSTRRQIAGKVYAIEHATEEIASIICQIADHQKSLAPKK
jgi:hypothetical protein